VCLIRCCCAFGDITSQSCRDFGLRCFWFAECMCFVAERICFSVGFGFWCRGTCWRMAVWRVALLLPDGLGFLSASPVFWLAGGRSCWRCVLRDVGVQGSRSAGRGYSGGIAEGTCLVQVLVVFLVCGVMGWLLWCGCALFGAAGVGCLFVIIGEAGFGSLRCSFCVLVAGRLYAWCLLRGFWRMDFRGVLVWIA